jgi:hypothetical protein
MKPRTAVYTYEVSVRDPISQFPKTIASHSVVAETPALACRKAELLAHVRYGDCSIRVYDIFERRVN